MRGRVARFTSSEPYYRPTILLVKLDTPWPGLLQQTCPTPLQLAPLTCLRIEASRASGLQTPGTWSTACTLFTCFRLLFLTPAAQYSLQSTAWGLNSTSVSAPQSPYTFQSPSSSSISQGNQLIPSTRPLHEDRESILHSHWSYNIFDCPKDFGANKAAGREADG